jgi:hypothetical protein
MPDTTPQPLSGAPESDAAFGAATGKRTWATCLSESGLPEEARQLVACVVKRTRLWRREKLAVAEELTAHFQDGLEAGETVEQLVRDFGNEKQAARLIRRGKVRNRPIIWQAFRVLRLAVAAIVLFYIGLAGVYFTGRPSPRTNYTVILNQQIEKTPIDQRAWPVYQRAILGLWPDGPSSAEHERIRKLLQDRTADKPKPELTEWLMSRTEALDLIRLGARLPAMGFVLGPGGSAYDRELWPNTPAPPPTSAAGEAGEPLISALLPHLNELRQLASLLDVDAQLATQQKDAARAAADIRAIHGMGRQTTGTFIVESLVGVGISTVALKRIEAVLTASPDLLSNAELTDIAHLVSGPTVTADLVHMDAERMFFADMMQRMYTDDGAGDGRLTPEGARLLTAIGGDGGGKGGQPSIGIVQGSTGPAAMLVMGSRRELQEAYDRYMAAAEAQLRRPTREADWPMVYRMVEEWGSSPVTAARHLPLRIMTPALQRLSTTGERYLGKRDGVLIGIALELYRREHGAYPQALTQLTPTLLPQVPPDRITGGSLVYKLVDGRPLVYSIGADRDDDGGRPAAGSGSSDLSMPYGAAEWDRMAKVFDGDWVLYGHR